MANAGGRHTGGGERVGFAARVTEGELRRKAADGHGGASARGKLDNRLRDEGSADAERITR
eukprot:3384577-Pleurochrysis_carterae.AAC.1